MDLTTSSIVWSFRSGQSPQPRWRKSLWWRISTPDVCPYELIHLQALHGFIRGLYLMFHGRSMCFDVLCFDRATQGHLDTYPGARAYAPEETHPHRSSCNWPHLSVLQFSPVPLFLLLWNTPISWGRHELAVLGKQFCFHLIRLEILFWGVLHQSPSHAI